MIRDWIRNWLGITNIDNSILNIKKSNDHIYSCLDADITKCNAQLVDIRKTIVNTHNKLNELDAKLRPDLRQRLEQVKSAFDINTKFFNKIMYEVMYEVRKL